MLIVDEGQGRAESEQCCYGASRASRPVVELPDEPERSTALPAWVEALPAQNGSRPPLSQAWAKNLQGLEIDGESFLTADLYGLDKSAAIGLVADAVDCNFRFTILPHPSDREQIQILCWRESQ